MIDPITMGIASGALSFLGGAAQRRANIKAANAAYRSTVAFTDRDFGVGINDLKIAAEDVNNQLGFQLFELGSEANRASANVTASTVERNVVGNTSMRSQAMVEMREALQADKLAQQAEANMIDVQNQMRSMKYNREATLAQAAQARSNAVASQPSTLGLLANAAATGVSMYSSGLSMQSAGTQLDLQKDLAGTVADRATRAGIGAERVSRFTSLINTGVS